MTQCIKISTKVPANDAKNGAVPETARLAIEPMIMRLMAERWSRSVEGVGRQARIF